MVSERAAVVGLQLTDHVLRVARVEFRDRPRLTDAAELWLPSGVVAGGRVENEQAVVQLIHRVWEQMAFHWEPIYLVLGSPDALLLQVELTDPAQTDALISEIGARAILEQVVTQVVPSHHGVAPVATALRSSVDRMVSMTERSGLSVAAIDTTPSALARTQPALWRSTEDLALRYGDGGNVWSVRVGSTVHGAMRMVPDQPATATFDAVGLGSDHRSFLAVPSLADVAISDRLSSRFSIGQLAVPVGAALAARDEGHLAVDLRKATPLDRGREHLSPAEPGVAWLVQSLPELVDTAERRRKRR